MTDRSRLLRLLTLSLFAVALGGCSGIPAPPEPSDAPQDSSGAAIPQPATSSLQGPVCAGGPFGCRTYSSVSGRDSSGELAWLQTQPLVVSTAFVNGTWAVGVKTPCNGLSVEVDVRKDKLIPGEISAKPKGCLGPASGYQNWACALFKQTVTWRLVARSLVLRNSHGTVEFQDSGPNPNY